MGQLQTSFKSLMRLYGFPVDVTRLVPGGADITVTINTRRRYIEEEKLVHEVSQNTTWFWFDIDDLTLAGFPTPMRKGDRVLDDGEYFTLYVSEKMMDGPNVIGYRVRAIGD